MTSDFYDTLETRAPEAREGSCLRPCAITCVALRVRRQSPDFSRVSTQMR